MIKEFIRSDGTNFANIDLPSIGPRLGIEAIATTI